MEMQFEPSFDAPIPGQSLTAELGNRPWQGPQQFSTVDEAIDFYMENMSSEEFMVQLVEILESGVPVSVLANTIQLGNVMEGKHSVDVGMLVMPMLMEMIMMIGDSAGVKYDDGMNDPNTPTIRDSAIAKAVAEYEEELKNIDVKEVVENLSDPDMEEPEVEEPKGLMARRK
tara:strand:+ start:640 stop:1155 length:516 start_codon:yes stop_codon:yes gene_type:complete